MTQTEHTTDTQKNEVQYPIYRFDPVSRIHWLEFDGKPEQEVISLLKSNGWRWSGYRKQWHTNRRFTEVPQGIAYTDGGKCDYSQERPDRLSNAAERATERSTEAYERSNALVEHIPFGQPVLVGHHSQRSHEKTLERSRSAMDKSVQEQKKAEHLEYKAKSSARHQAYKEKPDVIARRIKRLKGEITSIENDRTRSIARVMWEYKDKSITVEEAKEKIAKIKVSQQDIVEKIQAEIAENEEALKEAGGLLTDRLTIEIGDVIMGRWQGRSKVMKINKRNGEITSYTCEPMGHDRSYCSKRIIPVTDVRGLVEKADGTDPNKPEQETALPMPELGEETVIRTVAQQQKPEREFKVKDVQTVEIYDNRTSLFPTPYALGCKVAHMIPSDARLILEPCAGTGSLINAVHVTLTMDRQQAFESLHCCEILPQLKSHLEARFNFVAHDFLTYNPTFKYDCIVMNPPYHNTEWMDHIEHALELLKPEGTLLAILPQGFTFREDKRIRAFRDLVNDYGYCEQLPEESFAESGTNVNTVLVSLVKPE